MGIAFEKFLAQILFWIYDFIDTIGAIFNILTGTQPVDDNKSTLLEVFVESAVTTKVLIGLCIVSVVIAGACMAVKTVKNVVKFKAGGEPTSHSVTVKQGFFAVLSSVVCIFFVFFFIAFSAMLLNMVNDVIAPEENLTLSQNLFNLSVEKSYVIDESKWEIRELGYYYDETGNRVQATDPKTGELLFETDEEGNLVEVWVQQVEYYHPYLYEDGEIVMETGWVNNHTVKDISWSMSPDEVFGVHKKDTFNIFEQSDKGYKRQPIVRLESFNLFTAYLVAIIMLISMFMLSIGLVKRIYDIVVLMICMPLVCGTIPLDDGARFRAWRETFMSKVLVAFGAVIAINVFYMISGLIMGPKFDLSYLINEGILNATAVTVFKMLLLLGGAMCINGSQTLIARILGTSADESREAMQSFAMITSGVRLGAMGALGAGRLALGTKNLVFGGTNRYGRQRTGIIPTLFRGGNAIGERLGGDNYINSRGGAFMRTLGRMGGRNSGYAPVGVNSNGGGNSGGMAQPGTIGGINSPLRGNMSVVSQSANSASGVTAQPNILPPVSGAVNGRQSGSAFTGSGAGKQSAAAQRGYEPSVRPTNSGLRSDNGGHKSSAFNDNKRGKR